MTGRYTMIALSAWLLYRIGCDVAEVFTRMADTLSHITR